MSGSATPQNPVLPEDPYIIIETKLSLDPTVEDAAVPSVGIGAAGGVVPLDADGQVPLQYLQLLIRYLGGTYTPGTTTATTPTTPATVDDALALPDGALLADGDGAVLLFPAGGTTTAAASVNAALTLADGATLADGDGAVLLFPVPAS